MKHQTSLKDLAEELGVSVATVSRALRDSHEVSRDMTAKVKALAEKRHYRPNPFARSLRSEVPKIIGVVVPNLVTHYYSTVLDGIEEYAASRGYSVICTNTHESYETEKRAIENFTALHVGGIIASPAQDTTDYSHFIQAGNEGTPIVFVSRTCLPDKFSHVVANGDVAAYEATCHLLDTGSKRIAFIGGPNHLDSVRRRKHGYLQALKDKGLPIDRSIIVCGKIDYESAKQTAASILGGDNPPDAILAFNDTITYGVFEAVRQLGLRIPQDVAIIGFTEGITSWFVTPKLSVIMDQSRVQGAKACELLLRAIDGDSKVYEEVVPMVLKIRDSSDKLK